MNKKIIEKITEIYQLTMHSPDGDTQDANDIAFKLLENLSALPTEAEIERVARAIYEETKHWGHECISIELAEPIARAAIKEMNRYCPQEERAKFESWAELNGQSIQSICGNGYTSKRTNWCWASWKAAIKAVKDL